MTQSDQPVAGSLTAKVIRACRTHANQCALDCPEREVNDLGEVAKFGNPATPKPEPEQQAKQ